MSADEMEVVNPHTTGRKFMVGADNKVSDTHECTFEGDHSKGLDVEDRCVICGKKMGDYIAEGNYDPTNPKIPIIIIPGEQ